MLPARLPSDGGDCAWSTYGAVHDRGSDGFLGELPGGGRHDCHRSAIMARVATTATDRHAVYTPGRPSMVSVGTIVWLASELMFFAALFAMYFTVGAVFGPVGCHTQGVKLDLPFRAVNHTVVVRWSV